MLQKRLSGHDGREDLLASDLKEIERIGLQS
jgi:hypothetical protein